MNVSGWEGNYPVSRGERVTFPGFTRVYREYTETSDSEEDSTDSNSDAEIISKNKRHKPVTRKIITAKTKYSKPKQGRYTEASLVKQLEKLGIGRQAHTVIWFQLFKIVVTLKSAIEGYVAK